MCLASGGLIVFVSQAILVCNSGENQILHAKYPGNLMLFQDFQVKYQKLREFHTVVLEIQNPDKNHSSI